MKKYKLTKETKEYLGITLYRIEALRDFGNVNKGEKGGWIDKEENLSQEGNAWVYGNAQVCGDARVYGNAWVYGNAQICGDAQIYGNAQVCGDAQIYGDAQVYDNAWVSGDAQVGGNAKICGDLRLTGGYFYHTKFKSNPLHTITIGDYEILCINPKIQKPNKDGEIQTY